MEKFKAIIEKVFSPNLTMEQFTFFLVGIILILGLLIISKIVKAKFKSLNLGLIFIALWSLLINIAFFFDYLELGTNFFVGTLIVLLIAFIAYSIAIWKINFKEVFDKNLLKYSISYCIVLFVILFAFLYVSPKDTVMPAPWLSNDSIVHSIIAKGKEISTASNLDPYFNKYYIKGFQSLIFHLSNIFSRETYYLLFPFTAIAYATLFFSFADILEDHKRITSFKKLLIIILAVLPFITIVSLYGLFVAQVAVIPVLLTCLYNIFKIDLKSTKPAFIAFVYLVFLGVINVYGVYAFTVIALGLGLKGLIEIRKNKIKPLITHFKSTIKKPSLRALFVSCAFAIITIPIIWQFVLNAQGSLRFNAIIFAVNPNFYSAFHLTGIWFSNDNFRDTATNLNSYKFFIVMAIIFFFIFKRKINEALTYSLITLATFLFVFVLILNVPYASFKYMTFFVPLFILAFGINYFYTTEKYKRLSILGMIFFIALTFGSYWRIFINEDTSTKKYLEEVESINNDYLKKGSTLIFSGETRLNYFSEESDDVFQTMWYLPKYEDQVIDFVIVQWRTVGVDLETYRMYSEFMDSHRDIKEEIANLKADCIEQRDEFTIYNLKCTNENL